MNQETETITNNFNRNKALVDIEETPEDYEIIPGTSQDKDPTVKVDATVPSYVFVTITDETEGLVTYAVANGWTALPGVENVYYREVDASDEVQEFAVLKDNRVEVLTTL